MAKLDRITFVDLNCSRRQFIRRSLTVGSVLAGSSMLGSLLTGCSSQSTPNSQNFEKLSVQLNWVKDVESAGMWAAMEKGYYEEEGLEVEVIGGGPQIDPTTVVAGGSCLIGRAANAVNHVKARLQGIPVKNFATTYQEAPSGLMSLAGNPIKTVQDAVGKRIGLQTGARATWGVVLRKAGLTEADMEIVNVGIDPTALVTDQVDGYWCYIINQPLALRAQGIDVYVLPVKEMDYVYYGDFFFTTDDVLEKNMDILVRWLRATIRGFEYNLEHPEEIARVTVSKYAAEGLTVENQIEVNRAQIPLMKSSLTEKKGLMWIEAKTWEETIEALLLTKQIEKPIAASEVMTTEVLEKVYGDKNKLGI